MFIRGGYNVYPAEVEAVLADHPLVREVVVVPRPDEVMGELGVAVVVPADARAAADARGPARPSREARLARYKLPEAHPRRRRDPAHRRCRRSTAQHFLRHFVEKTAASCRKNGLFS